MPPNANPEVVMRQGSRSKVHAEAGRAVGRKCAVHCHLVLARILANCSRRCLVGTLLGEMTSGRCRPTAATPSATG